MIAGYTDPQIKALRAAFHKGSAMQAAVGRAGGAYSRLCDRMALDGLLTPAPHVITPKGLSALKVIYTKRWADRGCGAYLADLIAVEAAISAQGAK